MRAGAAALLALAAACGPAAEELPVHRVVYGGDVLLGRRLNAALVRDPDAVLAGVAPLLGGAELAIVNGEGVIAAGGAFADKGESRPHQYRAHPAAAAMLARAGVDVVTLANNHAGDYGPAALVEAVDRLRAEGIDVVGAGEDLAAASRPAYRALGDLVVAVVGADLSYYDAWRAGPRRPGTLAFPTIRPRREDDAAVAALAEIAAEARRHAHVVLLTVHWGPGFEPEVPASERRLGARLVREAGFDAVLGHGSHLVRGAEAVDGRAVLHDAGNLVLDYAARDDAHRAVLWELEVTRAGVRRTRAHPLRLGRNRVEPAAGEDAEAVLSALEERSAALGARLLREGDTAVLELSPSPRARRPAEPPPAPPPAPRCIRRAPGRVLVDGVPEGVRRVSARWAPGLRLLGVELVADALREPKAGQVVRTWWTAERPVEGDPWIVAAARIEGPDGSAAGSASAPHLPGDWLLPAARWPPGAVVEDAVLLRMPDHRGGGRARFLVGLAEGGRRRLAPETADLPVEDGLLVVGAVPYRRGARRVLAFPAAQPDRPPGRPLGPDLLGLDDAPPDCPAGAR